MFPGESEIDQLYVIQKIIGPLPPEQMHLFNLNPRFRGLKFPTEIKPLTLKHKYQHTVPSDLLEFLEATLRLEARKRLSIDQCASHRAFKKLRNENSRENLNSEGSNDNNNGNGHENEESWKEIQFEDPRSESKKASSILQNDNGKYESKKGYQVCSNQQSKDRTSNKPPDEMRCDRMQEKTYRKDSKSDESINNGSVDDSSHKKQFNDPESRVPESRTKEPKSLENRAATVPKPVTYKKISNPNDLRLEMGKLTKHFGKYNKPGANTNSVGMIRASNLEWSSQPGYSNAGHKSYHQRNSIAQPASQVNLFQKITIILFVISRTATYKYT